MDINFIKGIVNGIIFTNGMIFIERIVCGYD